MKILNGDITQLNTGTLQGKLFNSFNLDLTFNKGKISVAPRTIVTTKSTDTTLENLGCPVGFKYFDGKWFTIANTKIFSNGGTPIGAFAEVTTPATTFSTDYSDLENFGDVLLFASNSDLYAKVANGSGTGALTSKRSFISSTSYHALCTYNNRAYWLDANEPPRIYSMDTAYSVSTSGSYTMQLPAEYNVTWIRSYSNGILIGTIHRFGGEALVFDWDGVTQNKWNRAYKVNAQGALACTVVNDVPVIMNSNGVLMQFTGSAFKELGRLPLKRNLLYRATNTTTTERFIHPNGLSPIDGNICALINNRENNTTTIEYMENIHSGIWEYDGTSLYHKYALGYRIRPDDDASTTQDYGQITMSRAGGLVETPDLFGTTELLKGNFLAGATVYTTSSISTGLMSGIWTDNYYDTLEKSAFFSTVQIRSEHFNQMWNAITTLYDPTNGFNFVVKYRTDKVNYTDFDITWSTVTSFTTTQTGLAVGDEITIIQGKGSGRVAHILSITGSGTFTVTLDETITGAIGTARARSENWKKLKAITKLNQKFEERLISQPDTLIELKVAMLCTGEATIDELILDNKKNT